MQIFSELNQLSEKQKKELEAPAPGFSGGNELTGNPGKRTIKDNKIVTKSQETKEPRNQEIKTSIEEVIKQDELKQSLKARIKEDMQAIYDRRLKKKNFEIYEDQELALKKYAVDYLEKTKSPIGESELIRIMIDTYLPVMREELNINP